MNYWRRSSQTEKVAIVVVALILLMAAVAAVVFLVALLGSDSGQVAQVTPEATSTELSAEVTPTPISEVEATPTSTSGSGAMVIGAKKTTVIIAVVPTPISGAPAITANANVNIRSGPGTQYSIIGVLGQGQSAQVIGVSPDRAWWVIKFPAASTGQGWVTTEFVTAQNTETVPVVEPPPLPSPTPPPVIITDWQGEYFANRDLSGEPVVVRNDPEINFDWGINPPSPEMPSENWSARWTISRNLPAGTYRLTLIVDDGARVWVDDTLIIDEWREGPARYIIADVNLVEGSHSARVEYFQAGGSALMSLQVSFVEGFPDWKAEYFNNPNLSDTPKVVRNEFSINYNWGSGSPIPEVIPDNNFSTRWSRRADFNKGVHIFRVNVEGGVRLWVDGVLLIDDWVSAGSRELVAESQELKKGGHDLRVDYFKSTGNGSIWVRWERKPDPGPPKAKINGTTKAQVGQVASFNARNSRPAEGSHIVTFDWDFGDGAQGSGVDVTHVYNAADVYEVALTVTDDKGLSHTDTHLIEITEAPVISEPPTAVIDAPDSGIVGQSVTFDASQSTGTNSLISYAWEFGDGTTADAVIINKTYNTAGIFTVRLTVTDDQSLQGSVTHQIEIAEPEATPTPEPEATETPAPEDTPTLEPEATETPVPEDTPTPEPEATETPVPEDTPTSEPEPTEPPKADLTGPTEAEVEQPVTLDGSGSQPGSSEIVSYQWDFGDGNIAVGEAVATHIYAAPGPYVVTLTVFDANELSDTATWEITITEAPSN